MKLPLSFHATAKETTGDSRLQKIVSGLLSLLHFRNLRFQRGVMAALAGVMGLIAISGINPAQARGGGGFGHMGGGMSHGGMAGGGFQGMGHGGMFGGGHISSSAFNLSGQNFSHNFNGQSFGQHQYQQFNNPGNRAVSGQVQANVPQDRAHSGQDQFGNGHNPDNRALDGRDQFGNGHNPDNRAADGQNQFGHGPNPDGRAHDGQNQPGIPLGSNQGHNGGFDHGDDSGHRGTGNIDQASSHGTFGDSPDHRGSNIGRANWDPGSGGHNAPGNHDQNNGWNSHNGHDRDYDQGNHDRDHTRDDGRHFDGNRHDGGDNDHRFEGGRFPHPDRNHFTHIDRDGHFSHFGGHNRAPHFDRGDHGHHEEHAPRVWEARWWHPVAHNHTGAVQAGGISFSLDSLWNSLFGHNSNSSTSGDNSSASGSTGDNGGTTTGNGTGGNDQAGGGWFGHHHKHHGPGTGTHGGNYGGGGTGNTQSNNDSASSWASFLFLTGLGATIGFLGTYGAMRWRHKKQNQKTQSQMHAMNADIQNLQQQNAALKAAHNSSTGGGSGGNPSGGNPSGGAGGGNGNQDGGPTLGTGGQTGASSGGSTSLNGNPIFTRNGNAPVNFGNNNAAGGFTHTGANDPAEEIRLFVEHFRSLGYNIANDADGRRVTATSRQFADNQTQSKIVATESGYEVHGQGADRNKGIADILQYLAAHKNGECKIDENAPEDFKREVIRQAALHRDITITAPDAETARLMNEAGYENPAPSAAARPAHRPTRDSTQDLQAA